MYKVKAHYTAQEFIEGRHGTDQDYAGHHYADRLADRGALMAELHVGPVKQLFAIN